MSVSSLPGLPGSPGSLSPWWRHGAILVAALGFSILSAVTVQTYRGAPPVPERVVDPCGATLFTGREILDGQEVFLRHGLMDHGTIWGHGGYLGPDYTAESLHRMAEVTQETLAAAEVGAAFASLPEGRRAAIQSETERELRRNTYDPATGTITYAPGQAAAYRASRGEWRDYFDGPAPAPGLGAHFLRDPGELEALAAYFSWATWATVAERPGTGHSYTNNFPYEPLAGNRPTSDAILWSALSLVSLLAALGAVLLAFGRFDFLGWRGEGGWRHRRHGPEPGAKAPPSHAVVPLFLGVVAVLFLLQAFAGGALAHFRVEPGAFFGLDLASFLPFPLLRTWHLQLAIFWMATAWVAGGLHLAPLLGGSDPPGQRAGAAVLLGALVVVVAGSMAGEALGLSGRLGSLWFWMGHQGSEYLELGRVWQLLLAAGLGLWLVLMFRALRPAMRSPEHGELASLFLYVAAAIPLFYAPAFFYGPRTNLAVIENWRFWIVHLWVEGFFELFATVLVAVMFYRMGLVTARTATRVVYLDAILYLGAGIVGTGHHWYFSGQGTLNMALAATFSAMEVVPLTLLTLDAWDFARLEKAQCAECGVVLGEPQRWAIRFLIAVGVWNFVGAGIFGFLINLPVVSYFEVGTTLTANHAHAATFGVFGMLALAVVVHSLRDLLDDAAWAREERLIRIGFWGLNAGLALMVLLDLFPAGVLQLRDSLANGYWHARRQAFLMAGPYHLLEWVRVVADTTFLLAGVLPIVAATLRGAAAARARLGRSRAEAGTAAGPLGPA